MCVASRASSGGPHRKGGPGQCHRCQLYGHAAANCNANPRCVKCLVPHWTRDCPLTRDSEEKPSCVNCGQNHTANYRGCPKAPKFVPKHRPNFKRPSTTPSAPPRNLQNFPALAVKKSAPMGAISRAAPSAPSAPFSNPWGKNQQPQPPRAATRGPQGETAQRTPPAFASAGPSSFGDDIQTVMSVLRAVSSSEIAEFASQLRACRNVEEKLLVLVRWTPQTEKYYPSFNANGLSNNILELTNVYVGVRCRHRANPGNFLKPIGLEPALSQATYKLRTDRTHASRGFVKMGPPDGGRPNPTCKITDWKRVSTLEKIDTRPLTAYLTFARQTKSTRHRCSYQPHQDSGRDASGGSGILGSSEVSA
ncbi:Nucleic-acid-binding protein from transposon X-element [Eumeta japonica]|uniref:Nucleic-acid-binding protein from transposon X-element n=1 Tax=Eumeta variegata TaxID=151549 RepID=A0A4C2A6P1_EUMVA|nr:Nucleic-acid-binding protein from transposon X-element [Eumeta japonica]